MKENTQDKSPPKQTPDPGAITNTSSPSSSVPQDDAFTPKELRRFKNLQQGRAHKWVERAFVLLLGSAIGGSVAAFLLAGRAMEGLEEIAAIDKKRGQAFGDAIVQLDAANTRIDGLADELVRANARKRDAEFVAGLVERNAEGTKKDLKILQDEKEFRQNVVRSFPRRSIIVKDFTDSLPDTIKFDKEYRDPKKKEVAPRLREIINDLNQPNAELRKISYPRASKNLVDLRYELLDAENNAEKNGKQDQQMFISKLRSTLGGHIKTMNEMIPMVRAGLDPTRDMDIPAIKAEGPGLP